MFGRVILILILTFVQWAVSLTPDYRYPASGSLLNLGCLDVALAQNSAPASSLRVSPREIDLGNIGPGQVAEGVFSLRGNGDAPMKWAVRGPEGWSLPEQQDLVGTMEDGQDQLQVRLRVSASNEPRPRSYPVRIDLEMDRRSMSLANELQPGIHRETIRITSPNGTRTLFLKFRLIRPESEPLLAVEPLRIDLGRIVVGQQVNRLVKVTNKGKNALKWSVDFATDERAAAETVTPDRYVSFFSEAAKTGEGYAVPARLKDSIEISDGWLEKNGYPRAEAGNSFLRYRFSGTGISLLFWKGPNSGNMVISIDDKIVGTESCHADTSAEGEYLVDDELPAGSHALTVAAKEGQIFLEGVKVYGVPVVKGNPGWVSISPSSGVTARETDYVNIAVNAQQLKPGFFGERIFFNSNGGDEYVEVSAEVVEESSVKILDVFRYARGSRYAYTTAPQTEAKGLTDRGYVKQGIAFRLFTPGTPGTTEFYRWYNAASGDCYYTHDPSIGKSLRGFVLEGSIGNIATSKLTGTRELYRWFNPLTGTHFYTTDPGAEGNAKRGYRFEGIAGYVR